MKKAIVILFALLCSAQHSNPPIKKINCNSYGTLIASFICKNGIVVSSDSRTVMYNTQRKVVAYFEETSKIFQIQNFLIAVAGQYTFDTTSIASLIKGISASNRLSDINLYAVHDSLLSYAKTKLSTFEYFSLYSNQFIISGYYQNIPTILYYDGGRRVEITGEGYITNSSKDNDRTSVERNIKPLTVEQLIPVSMKFVTDIEEVSNKKDKWSIIGGPVSAASIMDNKITWIKDQSRNNFESTRDFYTSYKSGKVRITYRSVKDSIDFPKRFPR